jgi:hypothetical protein
MVNTPLFNLSSNWESSVRQAFKRYAATTDKLLNTAFSLPAGIVEV